MKYLFLFIIFHAIFFANGQDISTSKLSWKITSLADRNANATSDYAAEFVTSGLETILWKQKSGAKITSLVIKKVDGAWLDVQKAGRTIFSVSANNQEGTLTFERSESKLHIVLKIPSDQPGQAQHYDFLVSEISVNY